MLPQITFEVGRNKIEIDCDLGLICKYLMSVRPQVASTSSVFLRKLSVRISVFDIIVTRCQNRITVGVSGVRKSETWFDL